MQHRTGKTGVLLGLFGLLAGCGLPAAASPVTSHSTLIPTAPTGLSISTSSNWSGYAGTASGFKLTYAAGNWIVPSVQAPNGFSSSWVGIDGDGNNHLIQTGTEQDFVNGQTIYRAWWEILPASETIINMVVQPGDTMFGSVQDLSGDNWLITLNDVTRNEPFSIKKHYAGPGASAEWIQEAPSINGRVATMAHYSTTEFSNALIAENFGGAFDPQLNYRGMAIAMRQSGRIVSSPSKPNASGNAFRVAYGSVAPPAP